MERTFERFVHDIVAQPLVFIVGLLVTVALGLIVDMWLNRLSEDSRRTPPEGVSAEN